MKKDITYEAVKVSNYEISLSLLFGKPVKDIRGYLTKELDEPTFQMTQVYFDDGTTLFAEGEYDMPYLVNGSAKFDDETLERLYQEAREEDEVS